MAFSPIGSIAPQYEQLNYWLKGYKQGTSTALSMATDATGGTTLARAELGNDGYFKTVGGAKFIPHYNQPYDLYLFPTAAEADADDTSNAIQVADNIKPPADQGNTATDLATTTAILTTDLTGVNTVKTRAYAVALDRGGAEWVFTGTTTLGSAGTSALASGFLYDLVGNQFKYNEDFVRVQAFGARAEFGLSGFTLPANDGGPALNDAFTYARTLKSVNETNLPLVIYPGGGRILTNELIDAGLCNIDLNGSMTITDQDIGIIRFYGTRTYVGVGQFVYDSANASTAREAIEIGDPVTQCSKNEYHSLITRNGYRGIVGRSTNAACFGMSFYNCRPDDNVDWSWHLQMKTGSTTFAFYNCHAKGLLANTSNKGMYIENLNEAIFSGGIAFDQMANGLALQSLNTRSIIMDHAAIESCKIVDATSPHMFLINGGTIKIGKTIVKTCTFAAGDGVKQDIIELQSSTLKAFLGDIEISNNQATDGSTTPGVGDYQQPATITQAAGTATAAVPAHGWANGDTVNHSGANEDDYNGDKIISNVTANTYDFTVPSGTASPATGTIVATRVVNGTLIHIDGNNATQIYTDDTNLADIDTGGNDHLVYNRGDVRGYATSSATVPAASQARRVYVNSAPAGGQPNDWVDDGSKNHIRSINYGGSRPGTATTAQLEDISDPINTDGKWEGKPVFNSTTNIPVWAATSAAGGAWVDSTGAVDHTPV